MAGLTRSRIQDIDLPPFDPLNRRAAELRAAGHHVISLGQAVPFFPPPDAALRAARAALDTPDVNRYATDPGLPGLRNALAERLAVIAGTSINGDDVVITAGANHGFTLALMTLVDPGDEVILPAPYFTNHQMAIAALGAIPVEAPSRGSRHLRCALDRYRAARDEAHEGGRALQFQQPNGSARSTRPKVSTSSCRPPVAGSWSSAMRPTCISSTTVRTGALRRRPNGGRTSSSSAASRSRSG